MDGGVSWLRVCGGLNLAVGTSVAVFLFLCGGANVQCLRWCIGLQERVEGEGDALKCIG